MVNCESLNNSSKQRQKFPSIVSSERIYGFRIMTSSYWKIAIFCLCPSLADWSRQAPIKVKKNYESKHTDVPSWLGSTALLQLQSAHRYDDRAGDRVCLRQITVHPQILRHHMPFRKLRAPLALPKHPSNGKNSLGSRLFAGEGIHWSHSMLPNSIFWWLTWTIMVVWVEGH